MSNGVERALVSLSCSVRWLSRLFSMTRLACFALKAVLSEIIQKSKSNCQGAMWEAGFSNTSVETENGRCLSLWKHQKAQLAKTINDDINLF